MELVGRDGEALLLVLVLAVVARRYGEEAVVGVVAQALHVEARQSTHGLQALLQVEELPVDGVELRLDGAAVRRLTAGVAYKSRLYHC